MMRAKTLRSGRQTISGHVLLNRRKQQAVFIGPRRSSV
uniref:Uncharacterized protein n=1 Tax=Tetranychus urticae TaxID=32264 RepID=T1JQ56_TETUR